MVEQAILKNPNRHAYEIAEEIGLTETMDYDKAIEYIRRVRKSMRSKGQIAIGNFASDNERLQDIETLFQERNGTMSPKTAYMLLMMNCYYRLRSDDDAIHMRAIDDTYEKNEQLDDPLPMHTAIRICDIALEHYTRSIDEKKNEVARKKGFPSAGLNYSDLSFIEKLEITDKELSLMRSISTVL